ncbi:hypothetical protein [Paenibacillus sp. 481]|uniref:hypothetical protein n=1 Tax=Paenibacillus sp. 481 TaxID=2835869 RepID=UPI001E40A1E6|nr:hypothetical protein [Paenibacillus sp. 481]UHA75282.1 hypothetical protein KIK04_09885 [Paenibacillus sp. 481]
MHRDESIQIDQAQLAAAWQQTLPCLLDAGDKATVLPDEGVPNGLRIHIDTAGRQLYSFDFQCKYVDSREVRLDLVDVERDGRTVDERTPIIQELTQNYARHIHECAQALHDLTHHGSQ